MLVITDDPYMYHCDPPLKLLYANYGYGCPDYTYLTNSIHNYSFNLIRMYGSNLSHVWSISLLS